VWPSCIYDAMFLQVNIGNVKVILYRPRRVYSGRRLAALLYYDFGARRGWVVSTTPRPLYPRE
jgi:hypothetical protein